MEKILNFSIDLSKIPQEKIKTKDKEGNDYKNGSQFVNLTLFINEEADNYGNDLKVILSQSKQEREEKASRIFIGEGKRNKQ